MTRASEAKNPFTITKAVDLNDRQILQFWVTTPGTSEDATNLARPTSPMPMFLLGGKGSGKTHLMRYHSFELQSLRFRDREQDLRTGVESDRYIGMYVRCSGLNTGRFSGKRQPDDLWHELFAYYIELWLTQHVLRIADSLEVGKVEGDESDFCASVIALVDRPPPQKIPTIAQLIKFIEDESRELDFQTNNCVINGKIDVRILATRGKLIFGIPKLLSERYAFLEKVTFVYGIDEFETLSAPQQRLINSLVRDRELPTTIRVGARLYGIKTLKTDGDQEENIPDSEFERLVLDEVFRTHKAAYRNFARALTAKRFSASEDGCEIRSPKKGAPRDWLTIFEVLDESWNSPIYLEVVRHAPSPGRRHFEILRNKLDNAGMDQVDEVIDLLSIPECPILEKVNLLMLYRELVSSRDPVSAARLIRTQCNGFMETGDRKKGFGSILDHYSSDLAAQLRRENGAKHFYLGLDNFIAMSAGLPRALLTTLRSIFDWSTYNEEDPLRSGYISIDAQYRGVIEASDWFFNNMRKAAHDGLLIQSATDRLAQIFRTNRFADRPTECSLNSFSVAEHELSEEAGRILGLAESRSFLNRVVGGQKHRNSKQVHIKFQLHPMLCPRWQLPLGRRGALPLSPSFANSIFEFDREGEFQAHLTKFRARMTFSRGSKQDEEQQSMARQRSLF